MTTPFDLPQYPGDVADTEQVVPVSAATLDATNLPPYPGDIAATPTPAHRVSASAFAPSLIRTYVPLGLTVLFTWISTNVHIAVPLGDQEIIKSAAVAAAVGVYYTAVRVLETKFPKVSVLLGSRKVPALYVPADSVKVP